MNEFYKCVFSQKDNFIPVNISLNYVYKIQEACIKILNVRHMNALRDKFEGVLFYEKLSTNLLGFMMLEILFKKQFIYWDKIENNEIPNQIIHNEIIYSVVSFNYGELPKINEDCLHQVIFCLKGNKNNGWVCGYADLNTLSNEKYRIPINDSILNRGKYYFVGFHKLKNFNLLCQ
jgi:hypothetical protein